MRRNISANIVSIGSMRIAEVREEKDGRRWKSSGLSARTLPSFSENDVARGWGESPPSVIHHDLITARTETRARSDVGFSPLRLLQRRCSYFIFLLALAREVRLGSGTTAIIEIISQVIGR